VPGGLREWKQGGTGGGGGAPGFRDFGAPRRGHPGFRPTHAILFNFFFQKKCETLFKRASVCSQSSFQGGWGPARKILGKGGDLLVLFWWAPHIERGGGGRPQKQQNFWWGDLPGPVWIFWAPGATGGPLSTWAKGDRRPGVFFSVGGGGKETGGDGTVQLLDFPGPTSPISQPAGQLLQKGGGGGGPGGFFPPGAVYCPKLSVFSLEEKKRSIIPLQHVWGISGRESSWALLKRSHVGRGQGGKFEG